MRSSHTLEQRMKDLLAQASVLAEASAGGLAEKTSHSKPSDIAPQSSGPSLYDELMHLFKAARTDSQRLNAITEAQTRIKDFKRRRASEETATQQEFWATQGVRYGMGKDYRTVAKETGLSEKQVWKARQKAGVDPRYGTPLTRKPTDEAA